MQKCFLFYISLVVFQPPIAQNYDFCKELISVVDIVDQAHYSPKPQNDSLSASVFTLFLKAIDHRQNIFLKADIEEFAKDKYVLDDFIKDKDCSFIDKYAAKLDERLNETEQILLDLRDKPLDYKSVDSLYFYNDERDRYFSSKESRAAFWNKNIRYKILQKVVEGYQNIEELKANFHNLEPEIKNEIITQELCSINEKKKTGSSLQYWVETTFLNEYLQYQDPNSTYLSASNKTMFDNSLSNTQYSFGIYTQKQNNGDIVISYIVPGSPAYKNGNLDENDKILSISNTDEVLKISCISSKSVDIFMNDKNHNELDFEIKKQNGQIKTVRLKKTKINNDSNTITGFVLEKEQRVGYIEIPSFYTDLESINGLGVANDVGKQIYKLQREDISALIIDLRYNGGGSMKEAADLAGMFIDRGPVAITTNRLSENYTMRDPNRGVILYKPIVVLVSQFSASASELFAGVLQDYNAAVIIGSTTHGKATSQQILPLKPSEDTNFVKLTVGEFFRVDGRSHQKIGINPDIVLPNIYDQIETQEAFRPFALANKTVEVKLPHRKNLNLPIEDLKKKSEVRTKNDSTFNRLTEINFTFVDDYINRNESFPLTLDFVFHDIKRYESLWEEYENLVSQGIFTTKVLNTSSTESIVSYNADEQESNQIKREEISKDPYINEALNITLDLLKQ